MTNVEELRALLKKFDVEYSEHAETDGTIDITMTEGSKNVVGYMGFHVTFNFNSDGGFEGVGVWE